MDYNYGGYLQVKLSDPFKDGRYTIVRKLGCVLLPLFRSRPAPTCSDGVTSLLSGSSRTLCTSTALSHCHIADPLSTARSVIQP